MDSRFQHRGLRVFGRAQGLYAEIRAGVLCAGWADRPLAMQLLRASASIGLNIAEGAGEFSPRDKARFYRIARRSASECDGALLLAETSELFTPAQRERLAAELDEIAALLTALVRSRDTPPSPLNPPSRPRSR